MTSVLSAIPRIPEGPQYTPTSIQKAKTKILRLLEENRVLLEEFLDEKLSIEKQVVNLAAERDLELARLQFEEEKTLKIAELERQLSAALIAVDQQTQEGRFQLETQTVHSITECMRVKFDKENFALVNEPSFFSIEPLPMKRNF